MDHADTVGDLYVTDVAGITMCRDEADIIGPFLRKLAAQVDFIVIADNNSVDGTRDILADLERELPLTVLDDPEVGYFQSAKMTDLAHRAASLGATWVVPADCDEVWYAPFHHRVADLLEELAPQWFCAAATLYDHVATAIDPDEPDPLSRLGWRRREPAPLVKVACRVRDDLTINQGNHSASYDGGATVYTDHLVIRHFPYRSSEQMIRKALNGAEAYAATDLPEDQGAHWRQYGQLIAQEGEAAFTENVFRKWFWSADPNADRSLLFDPCPV